MKIEYTYKHWNVLVNTEASSYVRVIVDGEERYYHTSDYGAIDDIEIENEYIRLYLEDGCMIQIKLEVDNFLVIDKFDEIGQFQRPIGSYVFGEA